MFFSEMTELATSFAFRLMEQQVAYAKRITEILAAPASDAMPCPAGTNAATSVDVILELPSAPPDVAPARAEIGSAARVGDVIAVEALPARDAGKATQIVSAAKRKRRKGAAGSTARAKRKHS